MKMKIRLSLLVLSLAGFASLAEPLTLDQAKTKIIPVLDGLLATHCGIACPGYRIEAQKSTGSEGADLGFEPTEVNPELRGINVALLVDDKTPKEESRALQQILSYRLANVVDVPVSVRIRAIPSATPAQTKPEPTLAAEPLWKTHFASLIWPLSCLLLATLGLFGLAYSLRHRSREAREAFERAQPRKEETPQVSAEETMRAESLLETRGEDLAWLLEEKAALGDNDAITRVLEAFSADLLSRRLSLSASAVSKLAEVSQNGIARRQTPEFVQWLESSLDGAHWRRASENTDPILAVQRLTDDGVVRVFRKLGSIEEQAVLITALAQKRWPLILSQISSAARIELGLAISELDQLPPTRLVSLRDKVVLALAEVQKQGATPEAGLVEDYSLYLSDREGKDLWQRLTLDSKRKAPRSIEELISSSHPDSLRSLSLSLDWPHLKALITGLDRGARTRLVQSLPKSLQERLNASVDMESGEGNAEDPNFLVARAQFVGAYRGLEAGHT